MKTIFVFVLLAVLDSNVFVHCNKKKSKGINLDLIHGGVVKPNLPIKRKPVYSTKEQIKRNTLKKLRQAKNAEEFLKLFAIPFKKRMIKPKLLPKTENKDRHTMLGEKTPAVEPEYELVMSAPSSNDQQQAETTIKLTDLGCKPRPTVFSLPSSRSYYNYPACYSLNQCGGCCNSQPGYICRPTELSIELAQSYQVNLLTGGAEPQTITLTHHKSCRCQCKLDQSDCLPTQTLDKNLCYCACQRQKEQCPANQVWSDPHCGCICKQKPEICPSKKEWNEETCSCQCIKQNCLTGQIQDPSTCYCIYVSLG